MSSKVRQEKLKRHDKSVSFKIRCKRGGMIKNHQLSKMYGCKMSLRMLMQTSDDPTITSVIRPK